MNINVNHKLEIKPIQIIAINNKIQGLVFFEKLIFFKDIVGILLTIKKPIILKLHKFRYSFWIKEKSNSKNINKGNKLKPAAAGEGTPTKYMLGSMGLDVK